MNAIPKKYSKTEPIRNKFPPIPIMQEQSYLQNRGNVVYRGMVSKTSDSYFRVLKEFSWKE